MIWNSGYLHSSNLSSNNFSICVSLAPPSPLGLVVADSRTSVLGVRWLTPAPPHGELLKYEIKYTAVNGTSISNTTSGNNTEFTLVGLQSVTIYSIKVRYIIV